MRRRQFLAGASLLAAVHGPIVLAGRVGKEGLTPEPLHRIFDERYAVYWKTEVA